MISNHSLAPSSLEGAVFAAVVIQEGSFEMAEAALLDAPYTMSKAGRQGATPHGPAASS
jgi:hypothetical protein